MNTTTKVGVHESPSVLQAVKEDLITIDLVSQLEIADGLKELLISKNITITMLLDTPVSELAKILGIDNYIAKLIHDAAKKTVKPVF
jgi:hypothetical protein